MISSPARSAEVPLEALHSVKMAEKESSEMRGALCRSYKMGPRMLSSSGERDLSVRNRRAMSGSTSENAANSSDRNGTAEMMVKKDACAA